MRLATLKINNGADTTVGAYVNNCYLDLHAATGGAIPANMIDFLEQGDAGMAQAREAIANLENRLDAGDPAALKGDDRSTPGVWHQ